MGTITKTYCDIKGCGEEAFHKQKTISIAFITEQTEGRLVDPYIEGVKLDFCKNHYQKYIECLPILGSGAQGYNEFEFRNI